MADRCRRCWAVAVVAPHGPYCRELPGKFSAGAGFRSYDPIRNGPMLWAGLDCGTTSCGAGSQVDRRWIIRDEVAVKKSDLKYFVDQRWGCMLQGVVDDGSFRDS